MFDPSTIHEFADDGLTSVFQEALQLSEASEALDLSLLLDGGFPYQPGEFVGRGGSGYVWKARHQESGELVALKVIPFEGDLAVALERWLREAEVAANVTHPHLLGIRDKGTLSDGQAAWLALEWIEGSDLQRKLECEGPMGWETLAPWMSTVCEGLAALHSCGLVHRDLKPSNFLYETASNRIVISDFGAALPIEVDRVTRTSEALVSFGYAAPEQLRPGREIDGRADQYSLATTLWELLSGELPMGSFPRLGSVAPGSPRWLDSVLRKAMSPVPHDRYPDIQAFSHALTGGPSRRRFFFQAILGLLVAAFPAYWLAGVMGPQDEPPRERHFQSDSLPVIKGVGVYIKIDVTIQPDGLIKMIIATRSDEALRGMKTQSALALLDAHGEAQLIIVNPNFGVTGRILPGNGSSRSDYLEAQIPTELAQRIVDIEFLTHPAGDQPNSPWYLEYPDVTKQDAKSLLVIVQDDAARKQRGGANSD